MNRRRGRNDELPIRGLSRADGGRALVVTPDPVVTLRLLTGWAIDHELPLSRLSVSQPTLEDIYLELTGPGAARSSENGGPGPCAVRPPCGGCLACQ